MELTPQGTSRPGDDHADRTKVLLVVLVALLALAVVALALVVTSRGGDGGAPGASPTPSPTVPSPTSAAPTSSTSSSATTATTPAPLRNDEARTVVWPKPGSGTTYSDPVDAAAGMATELAGFTSPVVGPFQRGDSRSGEVGIKPESKGPVSTALVRQLSDNHWYVIGMASDDLRLDVPDVGATVSSPVRVTGRSTAFEGVILVTVLSQADSQPLGRKPLIGGSNGQMGPFSGRVDYEASGGGTGAIMLATHSAKDGSVWQVTIVPVTLAATG